MLPIKKIYIDTRQRTADSASHSDFSIDLPTTILMPDDTGFYVEDVCLPMSWYTVEEGVNDLLLWGMQLLGFPGALPRMDYIPTGVYTTEELGVAIVKVMNAYFGPAATARFESRYTKAQNALTIKWVDSYNANNGVSFFCIFTNSQISEIIAGAPASGGVYSQIHLDRSINDLLKNTGGLNYTKTFPFVSGSLDMNPLRNAYLTCTGLGNFSTMSLTGDRNIIKKIPLNGQPGSIIYDSSQTGVDYLDCSRQTLSRISFKLTDIYGRTINLRGFHWSFSLVFSRIQNGI
jgi:hypothetical protein